MISYRALLASRHVLQCKERVSSLPSASWKASNRGFSRSFSITPGSVARCHLAKSRQVLLPKQTLSSIRFASTSATTTSSPLASLPPSPPIDAISTSSEPWASTLDGIAFGSVPITEHIGFLKELGLDFGWGPTAFMETLLEHVHVYSGLPWWASIVVTASMVRLVMLKLYVNASDTSARMALLTPYIAPIMDRVSESKKTGDTAALAMATTEIGQVYKRARIQRWKMFAPMVAIPLGYGSFVLLRRMAALPVPGLDEGGFLWLKDLTVADPYFTLPLMTALFIYRSLKQANEISMEGFSSPMSMSPTIRNAVTYVLPIFTGVLMAWWPACLQLSFAVSSVLAHLTNSLLRIPLIRRILQIQPLTKSSPSSSSGGGGGGQYSGTLTLPPHPEPAVTAVAAEGKQSGISSVITDVRTKAGGVLKRAQDIAAQSEKKGRLTPAELRSAQAYEAKRKRELELQKLKEGGDREGRRKIRKRSN